MAPSSRHLLAVALVLLLGQATDGEPAGAKAQEIERLVQDLGSSKFEEREVASRRLVQIGEAALPALKRAAASEDAEVRGRAGRLATLVQFRMEAREARRIIERGVQALGGEEKLTRHKALRYRYKTTTWWGNSNWFTITKGERLLRYPRQFRETSTTFFGISDKVLGTEVKAFDGEREWSRGRSGTDGELWEGEGAGARDALHAQAVTTLVPLLRGEDYGLSLLGVDGAADGGLVGVRVTPRDHRDIKLFFDPKSWLLVRYETEKMLSCGLVFCREASLGDYADFGGIRRPQKITTKLRDPAGRVEPSNSEEVELSDYEVLRDVDPSLFARPKGPGEAPTGPRGR
jgi:hypothetical protein